MDSRGGEDSQQGGSWRTSEVADCGVGWAQLQLASETAAGGPHDRLCNPGFQHREIKLQTSDYKLLWGVVAVGETSSLTGQLIVETHRVLDHT